MTTMALAVEGMTCAACVGRVERALARVEGVDSASVNLVSGRALLAVQPSTGLEARVTEALKDAGYDGHVLAPAERPRADAKDRSGRDLLVAAVFAVPLFVGSMLPMLLGVEHADCDSDSTFAPHGGWTMWAMGWGGFALALPVQLYGARHFYRRAFSEVRHLSLGMNTLVAIGSTAAFVYSVVALVAPSLFPPGAATTYFEASSSVITLVLLGKWLEERAKGRASRALDALVALRPTTARVELEGELVDVPLERVRIGARVVVRPGERVPVDGVVVEGRGAVDESMLTGESMPVDKEPDDRVSAGTQNGNGALTVRVDKLGDETILARIVRAVELAQGSKPKVQALADAIAGVFAPAAIGVAVVTFVAWAAFGIEPAMRNAFVHAVAVVVVACPCAMGLATPVALTVALGRAAELGLLFRNADAVGALAGVNAIVLDKTGTITAGRPTLAQVAVVDGEDEAHVLAAAAAVESQSEHPIAAAIVEGAHARGLTVPAVSGVEAQPGRGVVGVVGGRAVRLGAEAHLGIAIPDALKDVAAERASNGETPVFVRVEDRVVAAVFVADAVRPSSRAAIAALGELGVAVSIVSGDRPETVASLARAVDVADSLGRATPLDKAKRVRALQKGGAKVAFVGDGINDAPALAQADVGVAMGSGSDVAIEAGDVVLLRGDLAALVSAIRLARRTERTIKWNFVWAYGYNFALIPLAAGVLVPLAGLSLSPTWAAAAMSLSSLFVVGNSLRIRRAR